MPRPGGPTDKVNSIGNSALYCSKKFEGNSQLFCKRKGDKHKKQTWPFRQMSWCSKLGVNIGPVTVGRNRIKSLGIFTRNHENLENHKESCLESLESQGMKRNH